MRGADSSSDGEKIDGNCTHAFSGAGPAIIGLDVTLNLNIAWVWRLFFAFIITFFPLI